MRSLIEQVVTDKYLRYYFRESKSTTTVYYYVTKYGHGAKEFKLCQVTHPVGGPGMGEGSIPDRDMNLQ